ncbi:MAG: hypothetical protein CVV64_12910 [Candidatus Wallbacteria bacterium HGW-Wallbacteria-1]|uniref:Secretin/TonB short N-terminal domain-containing protein n=1 Tax=Candidatus Wallbacteria bacterium HGW-Wallbacteria-1 TaxID=2013854 RepID=A0A2N1PMY2_9BACT|nr:MAG: hypothetical protein CVV64_12910 [Candidatus Wallbacteria bacterium HGW-Wallbacteria-1]
MTGRLSFKADVFNFNAFSSFKYAFVIASIVYFTAQAVPILDTACAAEGHLPEVLAGQSQFSEYLNISPGSIEVYDARTLIDLIAASTGINILVSPSVHGKIDVSFKDVHFNQALDAVAGKLKCSHSIVAGNIHIIASQTVVDRINDCLDMGFREKAVANMNSYSTESSAYGGNQVAKSSASGYFSLKTGQIDLSDLMRLIAKYGNMELDLSQDVRGMTRVKLSDVMHDPVLRCISVLNGYDCSYENGVYRIFPFKAD